MEHFPVQSREKESPQGRLRGEGWPLGESWAREEPSDQWPGPWASVLPTEKRGPLTSETCSPDRKMSLITPARSLSSLEPPSHPVMWPSIGTDESHQTTVRGKGPRQAQAHTLLET